MTKRFFVGLAAVAMAGCMAEDDAIPDGSLPMDAPDAGDAGRDSQAPDSGDSDAGLDGGDATATPYTLETHVLAPLAGPHQTRAPGQEDLRFYGTDLGYTFEHQGVLRIVFGDTTLNETMQIVQYDDAFGTLAFDQCPAGDEVDAFVAQSSRSEWWKRPGPALAFATREDSADDLAYLHLMRDGEAATLGPLQVPIGAFSDGEHAFALFNRSEFVTCTDDDRGDCPDDFECATDLGTCVGLPFELPCMPGATTPESGKCPREAQCVLMGGFCRDPMNNSLDDGENAGRILTVVQRLQVGVESAETKGEFHSTQWVTSKLMNSSTRAVRDFEGKDYRAPNGEHLERSKVLVWGRGNYIGSKAHQREAQVYLAVADMPEVNADGSPTWSPKYFAGMNDDGTPRLVEEQSLALPLDLSGGQGDPHEEIDVINQMSVSYVEALGRWVMLYGGDLDPEGREFYNPGASRNEGGAIVARFAEQPWGPWSKPQPILSAGDPGDANAEGSQYGSGGVLYHPDCEGECVPGDAMPVIPDGKLVDYGWLYGANAIDCWTTDHGDDGVDLYWNVSTWNPYQVVLMKTRVTPNE